MVMEDDTEATGDEIERHLIASALAALYWYPDRPEKAGIILPDLPEVRGDDQRLVETQSAFIKFAQTDAATVFYAMEQWGREKGWSRTDLLALMRYISRMERKDKVQKWVNEIGGSTRFKWPGHPIVRSPDGQLLPRGLAPLPREILFDQRLSDTAVRLYGVILSYAEQEEDGVWRATVPVPRLIQHLKLTEPTLRHHMKQLEKHGYVRDIGQKHGGNNPNTYEITVEP